MVKRRKNISPERILDYLGTVGASPSVRLVALAIYHSINGTDPSLELLAFRTGMTVESLSENAIRVLEEVGVLFHMEGRMALQVPDFVLPEIERKFDPKKNPVSTADEVGKILNQFKVGWTNRYERQCSLNGRDRARVADLVEKIGYRGVSQRLQNYLNDNNNWLVEHCHPLAVFLKTSNNYCRGSHGKASIIKRDSDEFDAEVRRFEKTRSEEGDL
jgi:hypothetical protein